MKRSRVTGIVTIAACSRAPVKAVGKLKILINQTKPNEIFRSLILWENTWCVSRWVGAT